MAVSLIRLRREPHGGTLDMFFLPSSVLPRVGQGNAEQRGPVWRYLLRGTKTKSGLHVLCLRNTELAFFFFSAVDWVISFAGDEFWTDSNGREMVRRVRDGRSTWVMKDLKEHTANPIGRNYYPITSAAYIQDADNGLQLILATERGQGAGNRQTDRRGGSGWLGQGSR
jgi:Glycosyl hydrolases family 38 C-terminal domain